MLTLALKPEQRRKVEAGHKKDRPSFYNSDARVQQQISEDMEAVLILTPAASRQQARTYMDGDQTAGVSADQQRDAVLAAGLTIDVQVAKQQVNELYADVQAVASLQKGVNDTPEFQGVSEVGPFVRALQLGHDQQASQLDQSKNRYVVAVTLQDRARTNSVSADLAKERKSWADVLKEYTGV